MDFFTCPKCHLTYPVTLGAFGLPGVDVCNECYKKDNQASNEVEQKSDRKTPLETGQDNNPEK